MARLLRNLLAGWLRVLADGSDRLAWAVAPEPPVAARRGAGGQVAEDSPAEGPVADAPVADGPVADDLPTNGPWAWPPDPPEHAGVAGVRWTDEGAPELRPPAPGRQGLAHQPASTPGYGVREGAGPSAYEPFGHPVGHPAADPHPTGEPGASSTDRSAVASWFGTDRHGDGTPGPLGAGAPHPVGPRRTTDQAARVDATHRPVWRRAWTALARYVGGADDAEPGWDDDGSGDAESYGEVPGGRLERPAPVPPGSHASGTRALGSHVSGSQAPGSPSFGRSSFGRFSFGWPVPAPRVVGTRQPESLPWTAGPTDWSPAAVDRWAVPRRASLPTRTGDHPMAWDAQAQLPPQEQRTPHGPRTAWAVIDAPPTDPWPALPDDEALWVPPVSAFSDLDHVRSLDDEQRGA